MELSFTSSGSFGGFQGWCRGLGGFVCGCLGLTGILGMMVVRFVRGRKLWTLARLVEVSRIRMIFKYYSSLGAHKAQKRTRVTRIILLTHLRGPNSFQIYHTTNLLKHTGFLSPIKAWGLEPYRNDKVFNTTPSTIPIKLPGIQKSIRLSTITIFTSPTSHVGPKSTEAPKYQ